MVWLVTLVPTNISLRLPVLEVVNDCYKLLTIEKYLQTFGAIVTEDKTPNSKYYLDD